MGTKRESPSRNARGFTTGSAIKPMDRKRGGLSKVPSRRGVSTLATLSSVRGLSAGVTGDFRKVGHELVCRHCGNIVDGKTAQMLERIALALGDSEKITVAWCLRCRPEKEEKNAAKKEAPQGYALPSPKRR